LFAQRGIFLCLQPFEQLAAIDREHAGMACLTVKTRSWQGWKNWSSSVGRSALPRRRAIEIDRQAASIGQAPFLHALRRVDIGHTQGSQQMLQERGLAVTGIAKQDREFHPIVFDLLPENIDPDQFRRRCVAAKAESSPRVSLLPWREPG
jgi:hypothetical protein